MARRKRQLLEDDFSDSSGSDDRDLDDPNEDADAREERALFENPYQRKKRRKNGKEDAIYGVFASSDEDEEKSGEGRKKRDWTKAPAFVSRQTVDLTKEMDVDEKEDEDEESDSEASEPDEDNKASESQDVSDEEAPPKSPSPRIVEEEEEKRPRFGGIGSKKSTTSDPTAFSGFSRGGIGSFKPATAKETTPTPMPARSPSPPAPSLTDTDLPSAFGASSRVQRSFVRNEDSASGSNTPRPAAPLSAAEAAHFSKLGGTFGARMLQKMGWKAGMGLGSTGEGIATPVESKLRPKGIGLAFKGFKERTEQSKAEARRRGDVVSDDEDTPRTKKKGKKGPGKGETSDAWKKPKKVKIKVAHKTYEQILAEAGEEVPPSGIGQIIDATGAAPREVASLADVSVASWTPTSDPLRLPELRHNLRLINDACKSDLEGLAREARTLEERKKWVRAEDLRLRKKVEEEAELISRFQQVHLVVDDINTQAKEMASMYEASLDPFSPNFDKLLGLYPKEFDRYRLDEVVVAAIAPVVRRMFAQWQPLKDPTMFTSNFKQWRKALKMTSPDEKPLESQVQVYGSSAVVVPPPVIEKPMTPYESLIWNAWLPKIRSSINNEWSPEDPQPAVRLYEAWSSLLPPFVRDNFFDQLVLPKVHQSVGDWNPRNHPVSLQTLVFPWLPHIGLRLEDVLGDARRKVKSLLRNWLVADGMPKDLLVWKDVFSIGDWDTMLLKYVVPKLGARLREDFRINPRKQDMEPLNDVLLWDHVLRPSIFSQLIEKEFFPKWLDVLHIWLIQPKPSFEEVSQWYTFWKKTFPEDVQSLPGIANGFTRGLQLMNKAIELGPDAPTRLPRPDYHPLVTTASGSATASRQNTPKPRPSRIQEITFRSIVEDFASSHNLLFVPTGKAHEVSRMPLFRVSQSVDGKGGLLVYIQDDAVWGPDGGQYRAITLEDMVLRAAKA